MQRVFLQISKRRWLQGTSVSLCWQRLLNTKVDQTNQHHFRWKRQRVAALDSLWWKITNSCSRLKQRLQSSDVCHVPFQSSPGAPACRSRWLCRWRTTWRWDPGTGRRTPRRATPGSGPRRRPGSAEEQWSWWVLKASWEGQEAAIVAVGGVTSPRPQLAHPAPSTGSAFAKERHITIQFYMTSSTALSYRLDQEVQDLLFRLQTFQHRRE